MRTGGCEANGGGRGPSDLDIVRYGTRRLRDPDLRIPHPELPNRDWWQREMDEVDVLAPKKVEE